MWRRLDDLSRPGWLVGGLSRLSTSHRLIRLIRLICFFIIQIPSLVEPENSPEKHFFEPF